MTEQQKAAIEEAAKRHAYNCDPDNVNPPKWADHYFSFKEGMKEAIKHPERYDLVPAAHTAALQERVKELDAKLTRLDKECEYLSAENSDLSYQIEGVRHDNKVLRERVKQLESETESRKHWQSQAQRYHKYHKELNAALERVKELEGAVVSELESILEQIQGVHSEYVEDVIKERISILKHGL